MEREKMIEEIAKKVCIACGKCKELKADCYLARNIASVMIDDGYRKVPDGAVVLTKEELEKMDNRKNYGDVVDTLFFRIRVLKREHENRLEQIRKDTAREILQEFDKRLTEKFLKSADEQEMTQTARILRNVCPVKVHRVRKELAEKYGVEV